MQRFMAARLGNLASYVDALVAVLLAIVLRELLMTWVPTGYNLFLAAIALSAWFGGLGPGLFATVLSGLVAGTLFGQVAGGSLDRQVELFLFLFEGGFIAILLHELRQTRAATAASKVAIERANVALRESVAALEREIDERRRAETSLRALTERHEQQARWLEVILKWSRDPVALFTPDGRSLLASDSMLAALGQTRDDLAASPSGTLALPEALRNRFQVRLEEVRRTGKAVVGEGIFPTNFGVRTAEYVLNPVRGPNGETESVLAVVRDMTVRRQREATLREREEFFRVVFERGPIGVAIVSPDGRILRSNARLSEMVGYAEDELAAKAFADLTHPDDRPTEQQLVDRLNQRELEHFEIEKRLVRKDGRVLWAQQVQSAVKDTTGQLLYELCMLEDVDEQRQMEHERRTLEHRLREAQRLESLGILAGGIAHDFNNLLVPVLGNAELILDDLPPGTQQRTYAQEIVNAAERAAQLARQMLAYSGRGRFVLEMVNLSEVVAGQRDLLRSAVGANTTLLFDLGDRLPTIEADVAQVRQILLNLVVNASEALGDRRGTVSVRTTKRFATRGFLSTAYLAADLPEDDYVCLEVSDTGSGMDAATVDRMFDPFFSTKGAGRGLGLPAVLGSVRGHGGSVHVDSQDGGGTSVVVLFPPHGAVRARPAALPLMPARQALTGVVLLVEDEEAVRTLTVRVLERAGLTPLVAEDGERGLELFDQRRDDIVCALVDIIVPRVGGDEVCRRLRAARPDLPIVAMSGYHAGAITSELHAVVDAVVQKPFNPSALEEVLRGAITARAAGAR